jgi:putative ABC transport system permease protein
MDALLQDLRYASRNLLKNPGFAALTIVCLAVGIGVNSTIFSVVDTVALRPLPFKDPAALVALHTLQVTAGISRGAVSYLDFRDWSEQTRAFDTLAAVSGRSVTVTDRDDSERFLGALVTSGMFPMLGIDPILGRHFSPDDDRPGAAAVVMLSHGVWQRRFLGDASIVDRSILVNGTPHRVIGVMPERFQFPELAQLWLPLTPIEFASPRGQRNARVFARLKPGVSIDSARRDLGDVAARLAVVFPEDKDFSATAIELRDDLMPADVKLMVGTMMGAVSLVLLIACANVANLLLARATARQREIAVRTAIGAGRGRIVRQLLTESVLIALASAPLGAALAYVGLRWLTASIPPEGQVPYYVNWDMNWRVVSYTGLVAVVTGVLFGLAPALHAADANLHRSLKDGMRGGSGGARRNRLRNTLVIAEIALSLVLLVGASLFVRSFLNLQSAGAGIDTRPLMTLRFFMSGDQYISEEARVRRVEDIVRRVEALPGVEAAFASNLVPLSGGGAGGPVEPEGMIVEPGKEPNIDYIAVTPHMFRTLGVPIASGRDFHDIEGATRSRVAIVNRALAHYLWPNRPDVVSLRFRFVNGADREWITVVGLTSDFHVYSVRDENVPTMAFVSYPYGAFPNTGLTIRVSEGVPPPSIMSAVREEIRRSDSLLPLFNVRTGEENRRITFWQDRLFGWMFSLFGAIALLLASIGIYGVLSYSVAQRTQEIGVRLALGASRRDVFRLVLLQAARLAAIGIALGAAGAALVTPLVRTIVYDVTPTDPVSFVGTALFLTLVAVAAGYLPARRATSVDPIVALRVE